MKMDVVLYSKSGEEISRYKVRNNETASDVVFAALLDKSWVLKLGDMIVVERKGQENEHQ